jgi:hypothetical protein
MENKTSNRLNFLDLTPMNLPGQLLVHTYQKTTFTDLIIPNELSPLQK